MILDKFRWMKAKLPLSQNVLAMENLRGEAAEMTNEDEDSNQHNCVALMIKL
jgi:hypothetical protein